ncbi:porin, partial [Prochlorococcus marinus CUG1415]|nr:porin [Prochlorococcus marinus CUG1415]
EFLMYEAFYTYPINDGMTVTPLVFVKETNGDDQTGIMVKTSFSF